MNKYFLAFLLLCACYHVPEDLHPQINYAVQDRYLKQLPSPFPPLSPAERSEDWSKEYLIGLGFAHELDLYQAMTSFRRAEYLTPPPDRKLEIQYDVFLCYYLGRKYPEAISAFEHSSLSTAPSTFPAYHDLLVLLYDSYLHNNDPDKADRILSYIQQLYPDTAAKLSLSGALVQADIPTLQKSPDPSVQTLLTQYDFQKKSIGGAQALNAVMPGAGYLYLGQKQSALTAFLLNGLFIWGTVSFFQHHNVAAGIVFASFEAGWYFGGIYGAGEEAKFYNERVYEQLATPMMNEKRLFPILMINHAF